MKTKAFSLAIVVLLSSAGSSVSHAQVTTTISSTTGAGDLGTKVNGGTALCTSNCVITGGTRPGNGPNLFHSLGLLSVGAGDTANFFNNTGLSTTNILSRVTGGNPSNIFGTIQTTDFGNANFFLINPAGVVFGPNASLDIGSSVGTPGSFHVSTADYLKMTDGSLFIANPAFENSVNSDGSVNTTVLSSAAPQAFGFLSSSPEAITFDNSFLAVGVGQTLSVVGGDFTMTGGMLAAPSGQINLASVASPGEVLLPTFAYGPNVNGQTFTDFGTVNVSQGATLDVSDNLFEGDGHAGTVLIRGGQFVIDSAFIFAQTFGDLPGEQTAIELDAHDSLTIQNGSFLFSAAYAGGRGGDVVLSAPVLTMDNAVIANLSFGDGDAGDISLNGGTLNLTNFAGVTTQTLGLGHGGNITFNADAVSLQVSLQGGATIESDTFSADPTGRGGDVTFNLGTGSLSLSDGHIVTTAADQRPAGNITINADSVSLDGPSSVLSGILGQGATGNISLDVGTLLLQGDASIVIQSFSDGQTGAIGIQASEGVTLSDGGRFIVTNFGAATGTSGSIEISAPSLAMNNGANINTINTSPARAGDVILEVGSLSITGGSTVLTNTGGPGRGGDIKVSGNSVSISGAGSGLFSDSNSSTTGRAGDIQIQANQVQMTDGTTISAKSLGTGDAGNITVTASDSLVMQSSSITTETTLSDGGNIHIQVGRLVQLTNSQITTSVQGGLGNGGNITIDPQFVILQGSQIIANAFGGNGGNILIVAGVFIADPTSTISASSTFGVSGTVEIQTTVSNLSESVTPLSGEFVQAAELLQARCAARLAGGTASSFVVAGRDGLPFEPGGLLPSPLFVERQGSPSLARSLDVPGLRALVPLEMGCAS